MGFLATSIGFILVFISLLWIATSWAAACFPLWKRPEHRHQLNKQKNVRAALFGLYLTACFLIIFFVYRGDSFCRMPYSQNYLFMTAKLALLIAIWDLIASVKGALASTVVRSVWITTVIVGVGLASLPFWIIYPGAGEFRFANTWADVSCFFTETNGWVLFPFLLTPVFTLMTLARELYLSRSG
jgi:hypothetical protein